jgi:hypothetical protein
MKANRVTKSTEVRRHTAYLENHYEESGLGGH